MVSDDKTYSIVFRVQRVTNEDAYVAVPVTDAVLKPEPEPDGTLRIDSDALVAEALRLSRHETVDWRVEDSATAIHPIQKPKPDDSTVVDAFYLNRDAGRGDP